MAQRLVAEIRLGRAGPRAEAFAHGAVVVRSPKGVRPSERALLLALPRGKSGSALVVEGTEALAAMALRALNPRLSVRCHFDDAWDLEAARRTAGRHPSLAPELTLGPDLPDGPWDLVLLPTEHDGPAELLHERLPLCLHLLRPGGLLLASTDNPRDRFLRRAVTKLFGSATALPAAAPRGGVAYVARRPKGLGAYDPAQRPAAREAKFTVREGEGEVEFVSRPGVFSHGRLDAGTRALLAVADLRDAARVLDLGCGVGVIGIVAARRLPGAQVTLVDSSARAVQCARRNVEAQRLTDRCRVVLTADPPRDLAPGYDLVLSNPPYYGDYRIAEMFLHAARRTLVPQGRVVVVTKGSGWYAEAMSRRFGNVDVKRRGGYAIVTSTNPP